MFQTETQLRRRRIILNRESGREKRSEEIMCFLDQNNGHIFGFSGFCRVMVTKDQVKESG